jgi:hypothetical protein
MKVKNNHSEKEFIPLNTEGKEVDLEHSITVASAEEAGEIFDMACNRLLRPSLWQELAGTAGASFELATVGNDGPNRPVVENDLIKIDVPGPGGILGEGGDWVKVEAIEKNFIPGAEESFGLRVRACNNPNTIVTDTAHFFKAEATSTYIIKRTGEKITLNYYGRNEMPNTHTISIIDNIRNGIVAAGAVTGLSNLQWKALLKGLVQRKED